MLVASANGSNATFAASHRKLLADLKKDAAGIGFDILDWGQSALNKLGLNAQLSPQQRVGLLTKVYEETLQRFELGDPQVQRKDLTALHQALNREITAVKTGQARAMTTVWEVAGGAAEMVRQGSVGLTAGIAAFIGGPAAGALAGGLQSLVTLAAMAGSAAAQGVPLESLDLPQKMLDDVGNVFTTLAGGPLLKLFGLPGAPTGPGVAALIAHAARQGTFDAILDGAVTTVGEAVANRQPIPEALRAGAVQGVASFLLSGTINGALGRLAAKQHTAMANTIKAMTQEEASAAVAQLDAANVARLREDAPMVYQALNQQSGGGLDAKVKAAGDGAPATGGAAPVKAGSNVLPSNTVQGANDLLTQANGRIGLGPQTGIPGSDSTAGGLPGGGIFGFGGNLPQFTASLPLLNGKKPTEFGAHADAMTAAVRYNGASEGDVAVPLRLRFKDAQGNAIERSVVYEGVAPAKVGELLNAVQKNKSYQVLNADTVLAEAGLSQKGLDARIARQNGSAPQPDATGTLDGTGATASAAGTAAAPTIRVSPDGLISGIPGMPQGVTAWIDKNADGGQDLRLEAKAPDGRPVTATIISSSGPIEELPAGFVETAQLFKQKVASGELKPKTEPAATARPVLGWLLDNADMPLPNVPSRTPDPSATKLAEQIKARTPAELDMTPPRVLDNLLAQLGEQVRVANPADPGTKTLREGYDHLLDHLRTKATADLETSIQNAGSYENWFSQRFGPKGAGLPEAAKLPRAEQEAIYIKLANEGLPRGADTESVVKLLAVVRDNPTDASRRLERSLLVAADARSMAADWGVKSVDERLATMREVLNRYNERNGTNFSADLIANSEDLAWQDNIVRAVNNRDKIAFSSSFLRGATYDQAVGVLTHELSHAQAWSDLDVDLRDGSVSTGANALTSLNLSIISSPRAWA